MATLHQHGRHDFDDERLSDVQGRRSPGRKDAGASAEASVRHPLVTTAAERRHGVTFSPWFSSQY